jgi:hypothetical protein
MIDLENDLRHTIQYRPEKKRQCFQSLVSPYWPTDKGLICVPLRLDQRLFGLSDLTVTHKHFGKGNSRGGGLGLFEGVRRPPLTKRNFKKKQSSSGTGTRAIVGRPDGALWGLARRARASEQVSSGSLCFSSFPVGTFPLASVRRGNKD